MSNPIQSSWRRRFKRVATGLLVLLIVAVFAGTLYERSERQRVAREFPPPGKLIDIGGRRIHLDCRGTGTPVVVLEAGADTSGSLLWYLQQGAVAEFTRVCVYDRAGLMWSDRATGLRDATAIANDLHKTLRAAHEPGPYVMVGASIGGPYVMAFTKHFGDVVAGVVFVDAAHPEQTQRLERASGHQEEGIPVVFTILAKLAWTGLPRLLLPAPEIPELPARVVAAIAAYQPISLEPAFAEAAAFNDTFREAGTLRTLGNRPLAVLTAAKPWEAYSAKQRAAAGMTREQWQRRQVEWFAMQDEEAGWSSQSTHRKLDDSSHVIQLERPDAVIGAIREVVDKVRAGAAKP